VCHTIVKIRTAPPGWACEATLTNAEKRWYAHRYIDATDPSHSVTQAPPGTRSFLQKLAADPETAHFVGAPSVFLSHAWSYRFRNVIAAVRSHVRALPEGAPPPFFWFDVFSIDEHATQALTQEWWSTTFQDAIRSIGRTLMVLSPWDNPLPLTRAWCLWEMYCTVSTGSEFSVCLGAAEEAALEAALLRDPGALLDAFATIDVRDAQAANPEDKEMVMGAISRLPGGPSELNSVAMGQMRDWVRLKVRAMVSARREGGGSGGLVREQGALGEVQQLARLLAGMGEVAEARRLYEEVIAGETEQLGASHTGTLTTKCNLAGLLGDMGELAEEIRM
jgi:hypothetical protein